jgi:hypothetical protein
MGAGPDAASRASPVLQASLGGGGGNSKMVLHQAFSTLLLSATNNPLKPLHPHPQAQATSIITIVPRLCGLISTSRHENRYQSRRHHAIFSHTERLIARYKDPLQRGGYSG